MRIEGFAATADLIGRRLRVRWTFQPESGESIADAPPVTLRRKERDFAFPPPGPGDPYLVYDSATFPPAPVSGALAVVDLPDRQIDDGARRIRERTVTVAELVAGQPREVLRRTVRTVFAADRTALRQEVELLDMGGVGGTLRPGVAYYYELDTPALPPDVDRADLRVTASPGEAYGLQRALYELIPEVHRRHDTIARAPDAGTGLLPEASANGGQLRRLVDVFGMALDALRSSAEGLWGVRDPATVDPKFLPVLAHWVGWEPTAAADLPLQRNEIRNAPRLYQAVGAIPGLRTIVDHYTGWSTRVAEFVQNLARTNAAAQRNLYGIVERAGDWWAIDDAAPLLGFTPPNATSVGGGGASAELVGGAVEPFPLRDGMTIAVAVDGGLPTTITFGAGDFADIGAATASEVAAAIDAHLDALQADAAGAAVRLRSHRLDDGSRLDVLPSVATLVSLAGAPGGRLASVIDAGGRLFLAYATTVGPGSTAPTRLELKPHLRGRWRDAQAVERQSLVPQADPAVTTLPGDELWLCWVEHPATDRAQLRWRRGTPRQLTPARLLGDGSEPFPLTAGGQMVLTGYGLPETFIVQPADYAAVGAATAAEVAAAINAQLAGVIAAPAPNGAVMLRTTASGPGARLQVDLAASTTARALGFADRRLAGQGGWDPVVDWGPAASISSVPAGRHADCTAVRDPGGGVWLFWSTHHHARWRIARARWDDRILAATAGGVGVRPPAGTWSSVTVADGLPSNDVRGLAVDGDGSTWYATAAGGARRQLDGTVTVLSNATTGGGLANDDVRAVAAAPDGTIWFAHPGGASARDAGATWLTVTSADGLASNDCRHLATAVDGTVWFATAAGLSRRDPTGAWRTWTLADGLPSNDVRHCAIGWDGALWAATAAGLAVLAPDGSARAVSLAAAGAPAGSDDARAVAPAPPPAGSAAGATGPIWAATAAGMVALRSLRHAEAEGLPEGLPSIDCRAALVAPDGSVWAGTPAGAARRPPQGAGGWQTVTTADGLPDDDVRALHGPWSAPAEFAPAAGGDRDPCAMVDGAGRVWLAWSERQGVGDANDTWLLRLRRFPWPGPAWTAPLAVTAVPATGRAADRQPSLAPTGVGGARVYFASDRSGGQRLWLAEVDPADAVSLPTQLTLGDAADSNPVVVTFADGTTWLLFRSDRNVPLGRLGGGAPSAMANGGAPSRRAAAEASIRRFAGALTVSPSDLERNRGRRRFGDLLCYTPQKPGGAAEGPLAPDEVYTRGTIGLYVERGPAGRPLTRDDADRLRQLLDRFLPVNLRAVIVLRPSAVLLEEVYPPGPLDDYRDEYPFVEVVGGPSDDWAAALPDWQLFLATDSASLTADPADLTTLRRRTWWPPPE